MVLPIPAGTGGNGGPFTDRQQNEVKKIGFVTLFMWGFFVYKVIVAPMMSINTLFTAIAGTFLAKDNFYLNKCFSCMQDTPCQFLGPGGQACIVPFALICMFNGIMDVIYCISIIPGTGLLPCTYALGCYMPLVLLLSTINELLGSYFAYMVYKAGQVSDGYESQYQPNSGGGGLFSGLTNNQNDPLREGRSGDASFKPFDGRGNRLGEV